jgi:hemoglobin
MTASGPSALSVFEAAGGMTFFEGLVARFYAGVASDPILRPMYPAADLAPAARRLTLFLAQYWGGPTTYSAERGLPRLRARHAFFPIDEAARDRWLLHMRAAVAESGATPEVAAELLRYFDAAADAMRNQP